MIADQALGVGRINGERQVVPQNVFSKNEASVRAKYGDAVSITII